jgi:hypothetical protein
MTLRLAPIIAVLALSAALPARAFADDDEKKSEKSEKSDKAESEMAASLSRYPPFSTRFKVMAAGLIVTGAAWGVSFGISRGWPEAPCHITLAGSFGPDGKTPCASGPPGYNALAIPVAGPWIALAKSGCPSDNPQCNGASIAGRGVAYVLDGIIQAAGVALFIQSLVMKTEPVESNKTSAFALRYRGLSATPVPLALPSGGGLGLVGTF